MRRAACAAAAGAVAAAGLTACGEDGAPSAAVDPTPTTAAARTAVGLELRDAYPDEAAPLTAASDGERVWAVGDDDAATVIAVDVASGKRVLRRAYGDRKRTDPANNAVTTGLGAVWVLAGRARRVFKLDPETGEVLAQAPTRGTQDVVIGGDHLYVSSFETNTVEEFDADLGLVRRLRVDHPTALAFEGGKLYVDSVRAKELVRFAPGSSEPEDRVSVKLDFEAKGAPGGPVRNVIGHGSVWMTNPVGNVVIRVPLDGGDKSVIDLEHGGYAWGMAADATGIWASTTGWLVHVDAESGEVDGALRTLPRKLARKSFGAGDMVVAGGSLWVGEPDKDRLARYDIVAASA